MRKETLLVVVLLSVITVTNGQRATSEFIIEDKQDVELENGPSASSFIETVLYNPDVVKMQLSKNEIQAVGLREGSNPHFVIHFYKNKLHNTWKTYYSNNTLTDSGSFSNGLPHGEWKTWYTNGQLKTIRNYNAEKYHYIKADIYRNHPRYQKYKITEYKQARNDVSQHFKPQYDQGNSAISKPLLDKIKTNTEDAGSTYVPPFSNSLHHGEFINYNIDGSVRDSGHYDNGLKHGIWIEREKEGTVRSIGYYHHGKRNGQWKHYDLKGTLLYNDFYKKNGLLDARHHFKK